MHCGNDPYQEFLQTHRVFKNLLTKLRKQGKIRKLRNRLYAVLPKYAKKHFMPPALLMAAKMAPDAVLGYGAALDFYGMSRNLLFHVPFLTRHRLSKTQSDSITFYPCLPPKTLWAHGHDAFGVEEHLLWDTKIKVVCKERLLVDLLDRPDLSGGWESIANDFQYEKSLNFRKLVEYLHLLKHPATSARVGFFLKRFQETMDVPEEVLLEIEGLKPKSPEYFYRTNRQGKFEKRWNLYVPEELFQPLDEVNYEF